MRNALAAIAVGAHAGLTAPVLADGLRAFRGIKRRLELVGEARGVTVLDDFAHHPTAVQETLSALRMGYPGRRIWAVFEPRSASSCRRVFQDDFAEAFGAADEVVVAPVFRSSLPESERLSVEQLVADLSSRQRRARTLPSVDGDRRDGGAGGRAPATSSCVMSNGGFDGIHGKLLHGPVGVTFPRLRDAGDSMLLFELEPVVDATVNRRAIGHRRGGARRPAARACATCAPPIAASPCSTTR